jgi:hypothetical protein
LARYDYLTFVDVVTHYFSNAAIGYAGANEAGLYCLAVGEYPNLLGLAALAALALCRSPLARSSRVAASVASRRIALSLTFSLALRPAGFHLRLQVCLLFI